MELPFDVGDVYWMPLRNSEKVTLPCPACKGERVVTIIYGGDEHVRVECEACGKGFDGPQGTITEWQFTPRAERFVIAGVEGLYSGRWTVRSEDGSTCDFDALCKTEEEALAESVRACEAREEQNMLTRQHARSRAKNATWSVKYHKDCIKDLERQIAWHTARISAGKVKKENK